MREPPYNRAGEAGGCRPTPVYSKRPIPAAVVTPVAASGTGPQLRPNCRFAPVPSGEAWDARSAAGLASSV